MLPGIAEAVCDAGDQQFILLIRLTLLRRCCRPSRQRRWRRPHGGIGWLHRLCSLSALAAGCEAILARTHKAPEMLRHHAAVQTLERELVLGLAGLVNLPEADELAGRTSLRRRGFERAVEHIRQADLSTLNLAALSTAAGVSQRTLEYAFQEKLGLSPMAFVRQLRLHALRRELLACQLGEANVTELAYHLGFTQLGRLAGDYRRTFGELPSHTLARPFKDDGARFWDNNWVPDRVSRFAAAAR